MPSKASQGSRPTPSLSSSPTGQPVPSSYSKLVSPLKSISAAASNLQAQVGSDGQDYICPTIVWSKLYLSNNCSINCWSKYTSRNQGSVGPPVVIPSPRTQKFWFLFDKHSHFRQEDIFEEDDKKTSTPFAISSTRNGWSGRHRPGTMPKQGWRPLASSGGPPGRRGGDVC